METAFFDVGNRRVKSYSIGNQKNPLLVIANSIGMGQAFINQLMVALSKHFYVMSWETYCLDGHTGLHLLNSFDEEAKFLRAIVKRNGSKTNYALGWSTGCETTLVATKKYRLNFEKIVLLNPLISVFIDDIYHSQFIKNMRELSWIILQSIDLSEKFIYSKSAFFGSSEENEDCKKKGNLHSLISINFSEKRRLLEYMTYMNGLFASNANSKTLEEYGGKIYFYAGNKDHITTSDSAREYAKLAVKSSLYIADNGTHYDCYDNKSCFNKIIEILLQ